MKDSSGAARLLVMRDNKRATSDDPVEARAAWSQPPGAAVRRGRMSTALA